MFRLFHFQRRRIIIYLSWFIILLKERVTKNERNRMFEKKRIVKVEEKEYFLEILQTNIYILLPILKLLII